MSLPGDLALLPGLAAFAWLQRGAVAGWWVGDDACHLATVARDGAWWSFHEAAGVYFTPLLQLSFALDWRLFGLASAGYYGHQLVSLALLLALTYLVLRSFLSPLGSGLAVFLFAVSPVVADTAHLLATRHYAEGAAWFLLALAGYRRALASDSWPTALAGAVAFLAALLSKEIFAPLVLILWLVAGDRPARRRARYLAPYLAALGAYALWRLAVLGPENALAVAGAGIAGGAAGGAAAFWGALGLATPAARVAGSGVLAAAAGVLLWRRRLRPAAVAVGLAALAAPLLPVVERLEARHLLLPLLGAVGLVGAALDLLAARHRSGAILLALALAGLGLAVWRGPERTAARAARAAHYRAEGEFVLAGEEDGVLWTTLSDASFLECLERVRRLATASPPGPGYCGDPCYLRRALRPVRVWRYRQGGVVRVPAAALGAASCAEERPLALELTHDRRAARVRWRFGPFTAGEWSVLVGAADSPSLSVPIALPASGSLPFALVEPLELVVRYDSPEGWRTYSPPLLLRPGGAVRHP